METTEVPSPKPRWSIMTTTTISLTRLSILVVSIYMLLTHNIIGGLLCVILFELSIIRHRLDSIEKNLIENEDETTEEK